MRSLALAAETQAIFDRIGSYAWTLDVYGMSQSRALWLVKARTQARINRAGIVPPYTNIYRRYVSELVRVFRSENGEKLIATVKLTIRKWVNIGLEPTLLQGLLSDCFLRFEQQGYAMPATQSLARRPRPRRRHGTYAGSLRKGRAALRKGSTVAEQAELQKRGAEVATDIARRLKPVLEARGVTGRAFIPYYNFAQKLGRLSRTYADKSLRMAAADLVDLYEARSLDGDTLRTIAAALFGITFDS
jgi:hypothetical protein